MTWRAISARHYSRVKIWDLRMYKEVHAYFSAVPAVHVDISQRGMLAVGYGGQGLATRFLFSWHSDSLLVEHSVPVYPHTLAASSCPVNLFPW